MCKRLLIITLLFCFSTLMPLMVMAQTDAVNDAIASETTSLLQSYLRIDTTNPPGHERKAAEFFKAIFDREKIENEIFDQGNDRANIIARLPGNGKQRPIILLNHLDVVPADAERWSLPPFSGEIKDGYVWGRGAIDMKTTAICQLMTMLILKRANRQLDRDIIFFGSVDEEEGAVDGVDWMIANHRDQLRNAEFVLTEGHTILVTNGKTEAWNVAATEKSVLWLRLTASGKAGHASIPEPDGAVAHLLNALNKIRDYQTPIRLLPSVEHYFRQLSKTSTTPLKEVLADPAASLKDSDRTQLLLSDANRNAFLRSTISITGLFGSNKVNVIPGEASATLDCRLLPGDSAEKFLETLKNIVNDAAIKFEILSSGRATESSIDSALFQAILRARDKFEADAPVLTPPLTSTTDASSLRAIGIVVYGFEPYHLSTDDDGSHGDNERISLTNVRSGLAITYQVIADVCGVANH